MVCKIHPQKKSTTAPLHSTLVIFMAIIFFSRSKSNCFQNCNRLHFLFELFRHLPNRLTGHVSTQLTVKRFKI